MKVTRIHCIACGQNLKHCKCPYPKQTIRIDLKKEDPDAGEKVNERQVQDRIRSLNV